MSKYPPRTSSTARQREQQEDPRRSDSSIRDPREPRYVAPIFPRQVDHEYDEDGPRPPAPRSETRRRPSSPPRLSSLSMKFVKSVHLNEYQACEQFIARNPGIWDEDLREYVQQARHYLAQGEADSRVLAFSCIEKIVILSGCKRRPPGTSFLKLLRARDEGATKEFKTSFTKLHDALKENGTEQAQGGNYQTSTERHSQPGSSEPTQSRQERRPIERQQQLPPPTGGRDSEPMRDRHSSTTEDAANTITSRTSRPAAADKKEPRESFHRRENVPEERSTQQSRQITTRELPERASGTADGTNNQRVADEGPQDARSRHSTEPARRGNQTSSSTRNPQDFSAAGAGAIREETVFTLRPGLRHSSIHPSTESGSTVINTPTQSSDSVRQRRDQQGNAGSQRGSTAQGGRRGTGSFPDRGPDRPATYRAAGTPVLDPNFRVVPMQQWDEYFVRGRVFAILTHHEDTSNRAADQNSLRETRDRYGNIIYTTIRRMVVVGRASGFCWAIPISTYGSRGLAKPGLSPTNIRAHAIIHMDNQTPQWLPREPRSPKRAIAVHPENPSQVLHPASRINFERVHTVEMNVRILHIGTVTEASLPFLEDYFRQESERVSSPNP